MTPPSPHAESAVHLLSEFHRASVTVGRLDHQNLRSSSSLAGPATPA